MINRIYKTEEEGKPIVHIIGKLDSAPVLDDFLTEIYNNYKNADYLRQHFRMILDLKETELITESCLEILKDYSEKFPVIFRNFSLYVELLLNEYGFLPENKID